MNPLEYRNTVIPPKHTKPSLRHQINHCPEGAPQTNIVELQYVSKKHNPLSDVAIKIDIYI